MATRSTVSGDLRFSLLTVVEQPASVEAYHPSYPLVVCTEQARYRLCHALLSKLWFAQTNCLLYSLKKARLDPLFDNVLRRKEHCHARCTQCAMFSARFARGFLSRAELQEWEDKRAVHRKRYTSNLWLETAEHYLSCCLLQVSRLEEERRNLNGTGSQ